MRYDCRTTNDEYPSGPHLPAAGLIYTAVVVACATAVALGRAVRADAGVTARTLVSSTPVAAFSSTTSVRPAVSPSTSAVEGGRLSVSPSTIPPGTGCAAVLSYLAANAAPNFQLVCPGYAEGAQALTCVGEAPCSPNQRMIVIADPCPAAYKNEAYISWVLLHDTQRTPVPGGDTTIDPFGHC